MAGISATGATVDVNDSVSVSGEVTAISGTGKTASITVKLANGNTVSVQAGDCFAPQGIGPALSENGKPFGIGSQVTIKGTVSSVSGSGSTASLAVTTKSGTTTTSIPSSSVYSPHSHK